MGPGRRMRRRGLIVGAAVGSAAARRNADNQQQADDDAQTAAAPAQSDMASQLEELQGLKNQGIITEDEFQAKKKQILGI